jgi:Zn-dependent protease with chaperone function
MSSSETDDSQIQTWLRYRRWAAPMRLLGIALWSAAWSLRSRAEVKPLWQSLLFWIVPILGAAISLLISCIASRRVLNQKWTISDLARLILWNTVSPTIYLLFIAVAFNSTYEGRATGILWLLAAGITALIGKRQSRSAEGLDLRQVRSGRLYVRAQQLSKKMGIRLERVYVVPAGRGHLTNAYGLSRSIAATDNYGKFLDEAELDSVIGHELTHVKQKHGRKELVIAVLLYGFLACLTLALSMIPPLPVSLQLPLVVLLICGPPMLLNFVSRRFEYAADRGSVELTNRPDVAIRALANLYRETLSPISCSRILELFQTHPPLLPRVSAIAQAWMLPLSEVDTILRESHLVSEQ